MPVASDIMATEHCRSTHGALIGTCKYMCPKKEMKLREQEGLLHQFEILTGTEDEWRPTADPLRTVKTFSRSAAGQERPLPCDLRPPHVLKETVVYLLESIVQMEDVHWTVVYDFVFDRLRAVRQEMVIQDLNLRHCIEILQPIVRFHAYSGYRLCNEPVTYFDAKLNRYHLLECLKQLLVMYDECELQKYEDDLGPIDLRHRPEMEALYLIVNLGFPEAIVRAQKLHPEWRTGLVNSALEMSLAHMARNYVRVCRLLPKLPALLACAAHHHLSAVRRLALCVMSTAYSNRAAYYPASHLSSLLLYKSEEVLLRDCHDYGIIVGEKGIHFLKGTFNMEAALCSPRRSQFVEEKLCVEDISDLLLGVKHESGQSAELCVEAISNLLLGVKHENGQSTDR